MTKFNQASFVNIRDARNDLDFPVFREDVYTEESDKINKKAMTRMSDGEKKILGLVSPRRKVIPYTDMMDWVTEEFTHLGMNFKLQESSLVGKSDNLYQQYLFDLDVSTPDNQDMSAMLILKGSHVGTPLKIDMGTFRFVCSNGVTVGDIINTISLKSKDLDGLLNYSLRDEISRGMEGMNKVASRYRDLANMDMMDVLIPLFNNPVFPVALKKSMLAMLETKGTATTLVNRVVKNSDFLFMRKEGRYLMNSNSEPISEIINPTHAYNIYNNATEIATHETRSSTDRNYYYNAISNVFEV